MRSTQNRAGRLKTTTEYIHGIKEVEAASQEIIQILVELDEMQQRFVMGNITATMHVHWCKSTLRYTGGMVLP